MEKEIEKLASRLYYEVIEEFYNRKEWDNRSLGEMIEQKLSSYNDTVKEMVWSSISSALSSEFTKSYPKIIPTKQELSSMLYRNSKDAAIATRNILRRVDLGKSSLKDIAMLLYEGYGLKTKEVLDVREDAPMYLQRYLSNNITQKQFDRQISMLKTKPYRTAMKQVSELADKHNDVAAQKAVKVALEEKARYYATRIAQTEQQRAISVARAKSYLQDDEIEFVKYRMSSKHPMTDICDYYAKLDIGYGKGIVPKNKMITLPLHPHCMCRYDPYYITPKRTTPKDPMDKMSKKEQVQVLGGYEQWHRWKEGDSVESVFNSSRPKFKIVPVKKFL